MFYNITTREALKLLAWHYRRPALNAIFFCASLYSLYKLTVLFLSF